MYRPVLSLCAALALTGQAAAAPVIPPLAQRPAPSRPALMPDAIVVTAADPAGFDAAVPAATLAGKRAGADVVNNNMQLNGAVSGNTAVNVYTGANAISSGSFSNASGLPVAIQNSGANVLIQNATIINVRVQ
ncbi:hypothetical protein LPN04_12200 [Rugamonas sp. A1-17]|nr:hypothetical protein [Rugamonas sp. A1-17]